MKAVSSRSPQINVRWKKTTEFIKFVLYPLGHVASLGNALEVQYNNSVGNKEMKLFS